MLNKKTLAELGPVELEQEKIFEERIGFSPQKIGDHQKVEILLYKDSSVTPLMILYAFG